MSDSQIKILVTGANGQLGMELRSWSGNPAFHFIFTDLPELDLTDKLLVDKFFSLHKPDFCINCASYTAVDKAESDRVAAFKINVTAVEYIAEICRDLNITLIHLSTDFVFPGNTPYPASENDPTGPLNYYGRTKLDGEIISLKVCHNTIIVRTSWLYSPYGGNFVKTMLRIAREKDSLNVVFDQVGSPTYARDLADALMNIISVINSGSRKMDDLRGIYHYSNEGVASWYDFAKAVFDIRHINVRINPVLSVDYPTPAIRPANSVLNKSKIKHTFGIEIPYWRDSLAKCLSLSVI